MTKKDKLLKEALVLPIQEKLDLIEELIKSLDKPDPEIDERWKKETESRIDACDDGEISSITLEETLCNITK